MLHLRLMQILNKILQSHTSKSTRQKRMKKIDFFEKYRQDALSDLKKSSFMKTMKSYWISQIKYHFNETKHTSDDLLQLGNQLGSIFKITAKIDEDARNQGLLSTAGHVFECLITWYVNLGLIGTNTIAIKFKKDLIPNAIKDALTVTYGNHGNPSNSESDIVVISFDQIKEEVFASIDPDILKNDKKFYKQLNELTDIHFRDIRVNVIQCKTNWNDNAQIPMAWDLIYSATQFNNDKIQVGIKGRKVNDLLSFKYSFATVPSQANSKQYTMKSVAVQRVHMLSGHNFWCSATKRDTDDLSKVVAYSIGEIFDLNFPSIFDPTKFSQRFEDLKGETLFLSDFDLNLDD